MDEHSGLGLPPRRNDGAPVSHFRNALLQRVVGGGMAEQPTTIGGYTLLSRVGEGGMGEVWRARSDRGQVVALKVLRRSYAQDANCRRRFVREARAAQSISHPGVVEIYEVGTSLDEQPFIAMELIEGGTIRSMIDTDAPLPWARACAVWMQAADALGAAHEHGIVHRDVKPSNILLQRDSAGVEQCRLIDFGLVRGLAGDASTELTTTGQLVGTPSYISPEALRGEQVDGRCDQYSLGCLAYELLEGTRPFRGAGIEELFMQHLRVPPPEPALVGVQASMRAQVSAILRKSLAKQASERFPSMSELVTALHAVCPGGAAIEVRRATPRPRPKLLWPLLLAVCIATAATAGLLWVRDGATSDGPMRTALASVAGAPEMPPISRPVADLTTGVGLSCALSEEGAVRCWGADSKGRLGTGTRGSNIGDNEHPRSATPLVLPPDERVKQIIGGPDARHVCVLYESGRLSCWGNNSDGELGLGTTLDWGNAPEETIEALPDLGLRDVEDLALGEGVTCARTRDAKAYCWGRGDAGLRGDGSTEMLGDDERLTDLRAVEVGDAAVVDLALGRDHGCALVHPAGDPDRSVRCWGSNEHGQLGVADWPFPVGDGAGNGLGTGSRPDNPSLSVGGLEGLDLLEVHAGGDRSCVVTEQGAVRCWGGDAFGVLGYTPDDIPWCDETKRCDLDTPPAVDLALGTKTIALALGTQHACAIDPVGDVRCWGVGSWGRLGDADPSRDQTGTELSRPASARVVDLGDFNGDGHSDEALQLSAANWHTCARMITGGVRCWGRGITGRLGYRSSDNIGDNETPAAYYEAVGYADIPVF